VFLFGGHVSAHNLLESKQDFFRGHGFFVVECSSHRASSADHQIAQETDAQTGHGGGMCMRLFQSTTKLVCFGFCGFDPPVSPFQELIQFVHQHRKQFWVFLDLNTLTQTIHVFAFFGCHGAAKSSRNQEAGVSCGALSHFDTVAFGGANGHYLVAAQ